MIAIGILLPGHSEPARPGNQAQRLKTPTTISTQQFLLVSNIESLSTTMSSENSKTTKVRSWMVTRPSGGSITTITATTTKTRKIKTVVVNLSTVESTASTTKEPETTELSRATPAISEKELKQTKTTEPTSLISAKGGSKAVSTSLTTILTSSMSTNHMTKMSMSTPTVGSLISTKPTRESTYKSLSPLSNVSAKEFVKTQLSSPTWTVSSEKSAKTTSPTTTTTITTQEATTGKAIGLTKTALSPTKSRTISKETSSTTAMATEESMIQKVGRPIGSTFTSFKQQLSAIPKVSSPIPEISALGSFVRKTTITSASSATSATIIQVPSPG